MRIWSRVSDRSVSFILETESVRQNTERVDTLFVGIIRYSCAVGVILEVWRSLHRTGPGARVPKRGGREALDQGGPIAWRSRSISAASWITQLTLLLKASRGIYFVDGPVGFLSSNLVELMSTGPRIGVRCLCLRASRTRRKKRKIAAKEEETV